MKANPDKCHFITSESKGLVINVKNNQITNSMCGKLLGIKMDHKLIFMLILMKYARKLVRK